VKLNIGGGKNHPKLKGWIIVDVDGNLDISCNIIKGLPFENNSVEIIYTSHTLEHIYVQYLPFVLNEFYRVLQKGGYIRIVVPDMRKIAEAYIKGDVDFFRRESDTMRVFERETGMPVSGLFVQLMMNTKIDEDYNGHVYQFDFSLLKWYLERAKFINIIQSEYRMSQIKELRGPAFDNYPVGSLYVEARK